MVDIISKKDGPRKEDVALKKFLRENNKTITGLADRLTMGGYSNSKKAASQPQAPSPSNDKKYFILSPHDNAGPPEPYVRISINGRVVIVDDRTSKQMAFLGEIRRTDQGRIFMLATRENKFFSPADEELTTQLEELDHIEMNDDQTEEWLKQQLSDKLGI